MAEPRTAQLISSEHFHGVARTLQLRLQGAPLAFRGGQYVIINSGIPLPGGKVAKRAYSVLSSDQAQDRIELAVRCLPGPGSGFLFHLPEGATVPFSGPWGKLTWDALAPAPPPARTLVVATDTGITAALGLARSCQRRPMDLVWMLSADDYFLPPAWVEQRAAPVPLRRVLLPSADSGLRPAWVRAWAESELRPRLPAAALLSGDGVLLRELRTWLLAAGLDPDQVRMETFFHHAERSTP